MPAGQSPNRGVVQVVVDVLRPFQRGQVERAGDERPSARGHEHRASSQLQPLVGAHHKAPIAFHLQLTDQMPQVNLFALAGRHIQRQERPRLCQEQPRQFPASAQRHAGNVVNGFVGVQRHALATDAEITVRIVGAQPQEGSRIPGIRKWPEAYLPKIYDPSRVDELIYVSQADAEDMARRLAAEEGLFCGISAAGACWAALQLAQNLSNATIVFIVCDRGDRYLSTGVFPA